MKNLIKAVTNEKRNRLEQFIFAINQLAHKSQLDIWMYNDLLPKGKDTSNMSFETLKAYIIGRKEKQINKSIEREVKKITTVYNSGELMSVKISVEWKRSKMWGSNPSAECWATYKDSEGNTNSHYITSGSISGCGFDKLSTAVANCLNQINEALKPLYKAKNEMPNKDNREVFGYGSGYGILPSIEGGVGTNCYPAIFKSIGYKFETVASGKTFDVFTINKS